MILGWGERQRLDIAWLQLELAVTVCNLGFPWSKTRHRPWILLLAKDSLVFSFSSPPTSSRCNSPSPSSHSPPFSSSLYAPPYDLVSGSFCCNKKPLPRTTTSYWGPVCGPRGLCCNRRGVGRKRWRGGLGSSGWLGFWWKPWLNPRKVLWPSFSPRSSCSSSTTCTS